MFRNIINYFLLIRIWQWLKNLIVFTIPIGFGTSDMELILKIVISFFGISFIASSIYILNDIKDINSDCSHPFKKNRPIASGEIETNNAIIYSVFLLITGLLILRFINLDTFILGSLYFVGGLLYTYIFKFFKYIDSLIISFLFLIRVMIGSFAVNIQPSFFLILFIATVSFSLSVSKRISILINTDISEQSEYKKFLIKAYDVQHLKNILKIFLMLSNLIYLFWVFNHVSFNNYNFANLMILVSSATIGRVLYGIYRLTITSGLEDFVLSIIKSKIDIIYLILTISLIILGIYF